MMDDHDDDDDDHDDDHDDDNKGALPDKKRRQFSSGLVFPSLSLR